MRVVFDTNTVVSALLFSKGRLAWLRAHWRDTHVVALASRETVDELIRVLSYSKFQLGKIDIEVLLADYLPFTELITVEQDNFSPRCNDEDDQMFVDLAIQGEADALISGDKDLLQMKLDQRLLTPAQYRSHILGE